MTWVRMQLLVWFSFARGCPTLARRTIGEAICHANPGGVKPVQNTRVVLQIVSARLFCIAIGLQDSSQHAHIPQLINSKATSESPDSHPACSGSSSGIDYSENADEGFDFLSNGSFSTTVGGNSEDPLHVSSPVDMAREKLAETSSNGEWMA